VTQSMRIQPNIANQARGVAAFNREEFIR